MTECVAVFLDGVSLPDEVYQKSDINVLAEQMITALGDGAQGEIRAAWPGPEETALFLFGVDGEAVFAAIQPVLESYPLGQNARVVIRHGKDELSPRTVRIPKRDA